MSTFDYITCEVPCDIANKQCQTKNTSAQFSDNYLIKADGTLWHEDYEIKDISDSTAKGLDSFICELARVNKRWAQELITGEIVFYYWDMDTRTSIDYSAYFVKGYLRELNKLNSS